MKIEVQNVSKQFGRTFALDHVSLTLEENRIYGLFGNNGAGKSTLLGLITNRLYPTEGNILVDGQPVEVTAQVYQGNYYVSADAVSTLLGIQAVQSDGVLILTVDTAADAG